MAGVNAETGHLLADFPHVEQSLGKIFSTYQGERVMREWFGNPGLALLGRPITEQNILLFYNIIFMLVELFEPRFKVTRIAPNSLERNGFTDFTMHGLHRPFAHLDWQQSAFFVSIRDGVATVQPAI